jgi:capsular polysaccharide biosynthesis protein
LYCYSSFKADENSYLLFRQKREEARIADALDQRKIVNVAIAEASTVPLVPSGLPLGIKLLLAIIIAAFLSSGIGFVVEYLDPTFRTAAEVKEYLDIPLLAAIPRNGH